MRHYIATPSFLLLTIAFMMSACSKSDLDKDLPACLQDKISGFRSQSLCADASVKEYRFQAQTVFVFDHGSCGADLTAEVVDMQCQPLGSLGGIAGNTRINGIDFSAATWVRTVWKK
jgi:hypothetical protein